MTENYILLLLGLIAACAMAATTAFLLTTGDLRRVLQQLHRFLTHCDQTRLEAERTLGVARQLLARTDRAAGQIQKMVEKTSGVAGAALEIISFLEEKVASLWSGHAGNGGRHSRSRKVKVYRIGNH